MSDTVGYPSIWIWIFSHGCTYLVTEASWLAVVSAKYESPVRVHAELLYFSLFFLYLVISFSFFLCSRRPSALAALPDLCAAAVLSIGSASVFSSFGFQHNLRLTITCVTLDNNQMVVDMANESWGVGLSFAVSMTIRSLSSVMHVMVKVGLHCAEN